MLVAALLWTAAANADDPFLRRTATVHAVEEVGPSVVNITTERAARPGRPFGGFRGDPLFDRFFRDFFEPRSGRSSQSLGSGVVIDEHHHVLTNEHVVARADVIRVTLADGREFEASLVGADPNHDLAVLKIESDEELPWTEPGDSADLLVGEPVIAIGNPFGLSNSVTTGVVSATNRSIRQENRVFHGFLQTDASINPGNSGGPLLDATGELIAINTAIYQGAQGIGFAIPIDTAKRVIHELITKGEVAPVWLGLDLQDLGPDLVELMQLPERMSGALVSRIRPDGPAAETRIARGDVVTGIDGSPIRSAREFYEFLQRTVPGQALEVRVWRAGETLTLGAETREIPEPAWSTMLEQMMGLTLTALPEGGFQVAATQAEGGAARTGIETGDRILGINGERLGDNASLRRAVLDLRGRARARVVVVRGRGRYHVTIPLS